MSDTGKATEPMELERQILSESEPKNEREWWAKAEIENLRRTIDKLVEDEAFKQVYKDIYYRRQNSKVVRKDDFRGFNDWDEIALFSCPHCESDFAVPHPYEHCLMCGGKILWDIEVFRWLE